MKIKSVLLGVTALAACALPAQSEQLGALTHVDVCTDNGIIGLTLSSNDNCLVISGGVNFETRMGNFEADGYNKPATGVGFIARWPGIPPAFPEMIWNAGEGDLSSRVDAWLKLVATSHTDVGPSSVTVKLLRDGTAPGENLAVDEAWVSIGDTTVLMAGRKQSIFSFADDDALAGAPGFMGTFYSHMSAKPPAPGVQGPPDSGAGRFQAMDVTLGGHVIQVTSELGNDITVSAGLEGLEKSVNAVGVIAYKTATFSSHLSGATNVESGSWVAHAGAQMRLDPLTVTAGFAADSTGYRNAVASAALMIDMFRLAGTAEYVSFSDDKAFAGFGASVSAMVSPGVSLHLAGRYFADTKTDERAGQIEAILAAPFSQTLSANVGIGAVNSTFENTVPLNPAPAPAIPPALDHIGEIGDVQYVRAGLDWRPSRDFMGSVSATVTTQGAYQMFVKATKSFQ